MASLYLKYVELFLQSPLLAQYDNIQYPLFYSEKDGRSLKKMKIETQPQDTFYRALLAHISNLNSLYLEDLNEDLKLL